MKALVKWYVTTKNLDLEFSYKVYPVKHQNVKKVGFASIEISLYNSKLSYSQNVQINSLLVVAYNICQY